MILPSADILVGLALITFTAYAVSEVSGLIE
jgi:hypothetical protein